MPRKRKWVDQFAHSGLRFKSDVKLDTSQIKDQRNRKNPVAVEFTEALMRYNEEKRWGNRATWGNVPMTRDELRANPFAGGPKKRRKK